MNAVVKSTPSPSTSVVVRMGQRFGVDPDKLLATLKATAFRGEVSNEQMMALLVVADQYGLNPFTKEIYAFPDKKNGIVPVVGVDGWSRIINSNSEFDGMEFVDGELNDQSMPTWIECAIYRKDRSHAIKIREYFAEAYRPPFKPQGKDYLVEGPWQSHPRRMLRHKAMIQCARMAFGFVGIFDQDEAERIIEVSSTPVDLGPRMDVTEVDQSMANKWVSDIAAILSQDKEEAEIAQNLRDANAELSQYPELFQVVFDRLAKDGIISKANYRKYLAK